MTPTRLHRGTSGRARATVFALLLAGACAHAPARPSSATGQAPQRVFVTGSRIPQWVDPSTSLPATTSPVTIIGRDRLRSTGRDGDLGAALQQLDPSVDVRHR